MHPYIAQVMAEARIADLRREAAAHRRPRHEETTSSTGTPRGGGPATGHRATGLLSSHLPAQRRTQEPVRQLSGVGSPSASQQQRAAVHGGTDEVLVTSGGSIDDADAAELCATGC